MGEEVFMFTENDVKEINERLRRDGIDFNVTLSENGNALVAERLEFGGCEDQDGALHSVIRDYFLRMNRKIHINGNRVEEG